MSKNLLFNNSHEDCYLRWLPLHGMKTLEVDVLTLFYDSISATLTQCDLFLPLILFGVMCVWFLMTYIHLTDFCARFKRVFTMSFVTNACIHMALLLIYLSVVLGVFFSYHFCMDMTHVFYLALCNFWPPSRGYRPSMRLTFLLLLMTTAEVWGADTDSTSSGPPMFKGTKFHYPMWFMAWCGWVALKFPELIDVLQGDEEEPEIDDPNDDDQVQANTDWWKKNKRLYGAILQAVPTSLKTTLNANARFNGVQALEVVRQRFGVVDASDRSSALKRVQKSYISPGAGVSVKDISRQYDRMSSAHAEYEAAGGNPLDDELLQSALLSALPASYLQIKTALRTQAHGDFDALYTALLAQVKQYEDDVDEQRNHAALLGHQGGFQGQQGQHGGFPDQQHQQNAFPGRGAPGRGRGGRGRGRGAVQTFLTCVRCGLLGHTRNVCTAAVTRCAYCAADHLSALCSRGPGGAQRDALSFGARNLVDSDTTRQQGQTGALAPQPPVPPPGAAPGGAAPPAVPAGQAHAPVPANGANAGAFANMDDAALFAAFAARFPQFGGAAQQQGFFCVSATVSPSYFSSVLRFLRSVAFLPVLLLCVLSWWQLAAATADKEQEYHDYVGVQPPATASTSTLMLLASQRLRGGGGNADSSNGDTSTAYSSNAELSSKYVLLAPQPPALHGYTPSSLTGYSPESTAAFEKAIAAQRERSDLCTAETYSPTSIPLFSDDLSKQVDALTKQMSDCRADDVAEAYLQSTTPVSLYRYRDEFYQYLQDLGLHLPPISDESIEYAHTTSLSFPDLVANLTSEDPIMEHNGESLLQDHRLPSPDRLFGEGRVLG